MTEPPTNPYVSCYLCAKKFVNWYFLDKHMNLKHPYAAAPDTKAPIKTVSAGDGCSGLSSETPLSQTTPYKAGTIDTKRKVKREPGNARKKRRKGGYTDKGRIAYRQENGAGSLVTGNERSCLPDAVWNVAPDTLKLHGVTYEGLKARMPY